VVERRAIAHGDSVTEVATTTRVTKSTLRRVSQAPSVAVIGLLLIAATGVVANPVAARPYPAQLAAAADALAAATGAAGAGYRFDVTQRQVEYPRPGGSMIPIVDPANPKSILRRVDHLYVNTVLARGAAAPGAFWMEMRYGPDETTAPNYDTSPTMFQVIAKNGGLWRNDGMGWYATSVSPGVGMDPATASLLPQLLRSVTNATNEGSDTVDGQAVRRYGGMVDVTSFPGVVASDGASFTESPISVRLWIDEADRLVQLEGRARNLNESTVDLKIVTTIRFSYEAAGAAPEPLPTVAPPADPHAPVGAP
jgi:hypothetical protein